MLLNTGFDIVKGKLLLGHRHVTITQTQDKRRRVPWVGTFPSSLVSRSYFFAAN